MPNKLPNLRKYDRTQPDFDKYATTALTVATQLVPVRTGRLRRSISASADRAGFTLRADAPYAGLIEYGEATRPPQPFMRPALLAALSELQSDFPR